MDEAVCHRKTCQLIVVGLDGGDEGGAAPVDGILLVFEEDLFH
jgi:hypothetical protein